MGKELIIKGADFSANAIGSGIVYPYTIQSNEIKGYNEPSYFSTENNVLKYFYATSGATGAAWAYVDLSDFVGKYVSISITGNYRILFLKNNTTYVNAETGTTTIVSDNDKSTSYPNRINSNPGKLLIASDMKFLNFATKVSGNSTGTVTIVISES